MEVANALLKIRLNRNETQSAMARGIGISIQNYFQVESGVRTHKSLVMQKMIKSSFYTKDERTVLKKRYAELKYKETAKGPLHKKPRTIKEGKNAKNAKNSPRAKLMNRRRIPNIENFYQDLDALGDLQEIDINNPSLQKLRVKVGGKKVYTGNEYNSNSRKGRERLAEILKEIRESRGYEVAKFGRLVGTTGENYRPIELAERSSKSSVLRGIVKSDFFTEEQSAELLDAFYEMQDEEYH